MSHVNFIILLQRHQSRWIRRIFMWWRECYYLISSFYITIIKCAVTNSCLILCNPMDCSTPGFPVLHYLTEFTQIHIHWVDDAIQHLILCRSLVRLHSIFPSIRVFSSKSALPISWPKYWNFSIHLPMNIQGWFLLGLAGLISLQSKGLSRVLSRTTFQKHHYFGIQPSLWCNSYICTWLLEKL